MAYKRGVGGGGGGGGVWCAMVVQQYCNSVSNADGEGQDKDGSLMHKSFEVNEYLVKAKGQREGSKCDLLLLTTYGSDADCRLRRRRTLSTGGHSASGSLLARLAPPPRSVPSACVLVCSLYYNGL